MKTFKFFNPHVYIKYYLFNLNDSVFDSLYSGFLFDLKVYSLRHFADKFNVQTSEDISSYHSFLFRLLLIDLQCADGDNLLEQVTNYFTIHSLHPNITNALSRYLKGIIDMDSSFIQDFYYYMLFLIIQNEMLDNDLAICKPLF